MEVRAPDARRGAMTTPGIPVNKTSDGDVPLEDRMLPKTFEPAEVEKKWYQMWLERRYFHAEAESTKKPFCIVIPRPT